MMDLELSPIAEAIIAVLGKEIARLNAQCALFAAENDRLRRKSKAGEPCGTGISADRH